MSLRTVLFVLTQAVAAMTARAMTIVDRAFDPSNIVSSTFGASAGTAHCAGDFTLENAATVDV